jgi:hypothetical protein
MLASAGVANPERDINTTAVDLIAAGDHLAGITAQRS